MGPDSTAEHTKKTILEALKEWEKKKQKLGRQLLSLKQGGFDDEQIASHQANLKQLFAKAFNAKVFGLLTEDQPRDQRSQEEPLRELLRFALEGIRLCNGVDRMRLYLYDVQRKVLELAMDDGHQDAEGKPVELSSPASRGRYDLGVSSDEEARSFVVKTFRRREPVLLPEGAAEREDAVLKRRLEMLDIDGPLAIVPIGYHVHNPIGVIGADNRHASGRPLSHEDAVSIMVLGNQVIAAVASTGRLEQEERLFRKQAEELRIHNDIARRIISQPQDIEGVYRHILDDALRVIDVQHGIIYRDLQEGVSPVAASADVPERPRLPDAVVRHFADDANLHHPILLGDPDSAPEAYRGFLARGFPDGKSFAAFCLYARGRGAPQERVRLGYLAVACRQPDCFTATVQLRLIGFVRLLAHAIYYHELTRKYEKSEHQKQVLIRNLEAINEMSPDDYQRDGYRSVLKKLTEFLAKEIGADYGFVCDWDGDVLLPIDAYPKDLFEQTARVRAEKGTYRQGDGSLVAQALNAPGPKPIIMENDTPRAEKEGRYPFRSIEDSQSELVVPIKDGPGGDVLCVFNFQSTQPGFFSAAHAEEIHQVSPVAVTAIKLIRHFDRYHSLAIHSRYFSRLAESIGDPRKTSELLLELVVEVGRRTADCKYGYVLVKDFAASEEVFQVAHALPRGQRPDTAPIHFRPGEGNVGQAIERQDVVICSDTSDKAGCPDYIPGWEGVRSEVAIPVIDRTRRGATREVIAVLLYAHTRPGRFREGQAVIDELRDLADQLGETIPNLKEALATAAPTPKRPATVFISYPHTHATFADDLYRLLERLGYRAHKDTYDVKAGDDIAKRIRDLVTESGLLVALLTPGAAESRWIAMEMDYAAGQGIPILPVELKAITKQEANAIPHVPRNTTHWLRAREGLDAIIESIESLLSPTA